MPPRHRALGSVLLGATLLLAAGCGSSGIKATAGSGSTAAPSAASSSTAPASSGQAGNAGDAGPATTTGAGGTTTTAAPAATSRPASTATTPFSAPEQSNCTPSADTLPDGLYFGYISEIMDDVLLFDLACWFTGAPAAKAAKDDKQESPPPNDYYIRNTSPKVRNVAVGPQVTVALLPNPGSPNTIAATYQEWGIARGTGYQPPIWITIQGGVLTRVVEQFLP